MCQNALSKPMHEPRRIPLNAKVSCSSLSLLTCRLAEQPGQLCPTMANEVKLHNDQSETSILQLKICSSWLVFYWNHLHFSSFSGLMSCH